MPKTKTCKICHEPFHPITREQTCQKYTCRLFWKRYKRRIYMRKYRKANKLNA